MRVVVTRPAAQADPLAQALKNQGFTPVYFPTIRISEPTDPGPLEEALISLDSFDWAIFTSVNAVDAVYQRLVRLDRPLPGQLHIAAIGPKTAARLESYGMRIDFIPEEYVSEAIVPGLGGLAGKRVFLPLADLADDVLEKTVSAAGGIPVHVTAYHTLPADPHPEGLSALQAGVEALTFTSGSTAINFVSIVRDSGLDPFNLPGNPIVACIGPRTAADARKAGFQVDIVAEEYTLEGLVGALGAAAESGPGGENTPGPARNLAAEVEA